MQLGQTHQKLNLICTSITSNQMNKLNFKSISQKTGEESPGNLFFAKDKNWRKRRSNVTKVDADLYYVKKISYI